jgi:hypothetical protein
MNDRLTAAALTLAHIALIGSLAASTLTTPAKAQGALGGLAGAVLEDTASKKSGC